MENKKNHLELIQGIIERLSNHSFQLKRWTVIVAIGILSIETSHFEKRNIYIAFIPVIIFWVLDGIYLSKERMFRSLFEHVRGLTEDQIDFNMDTDRFHAGKNTWLSSFCSSTIAIFYVSLIISMMLVIILIK